MPNEDKATRYQRLRRRAGVGNAGLTALFLLLLIVTGGSAAIRDALGTRIDSPSIAAAAIHALLLTTAVVLIRLPLVWYRDFVLDRRYGLATQSAAAWWASGLTGATIGVACVTAGAGMLWALLWWSPEWWWLPAALLGASGLVLLAHVAPVTILPLFYDLKPVRRADLVERLTVLARRADTPVLGVFEWRVAHRTRTAHAALVGVGSGRRILLSDTLLAEHTDDEIEVIVAHELAHHAHRDVWEALLVEAVCIAAAFLFADRVLAHVGPGLGFEGKGDIAAMPLVGLSLAGASLALVPVANAFSRRHERRADRYALEITRNPSAFVNAVRRLAARNLAEDRPSRLVRLLFHTHPSFHARIEQARTWRARGASRT